MTDITTTDNEDRERALLTRLAGLAILQKRLSQLVKEAKDEYRALGATGRRSAAFDGMEAATVSVDRGSDGHWTVKDAKAYGAWLAAHGREADTVHVAYPLSDATTDAFIRTLVPDEDSDVPDGVTWTGAKEGAIRVTLAKDAVDHAFDPKRMAQIALPLITAQ